MIGIYKITNQVNGKVYIGQSIHINHRWSQHKNEAKNDRCNTLLYNAMKKYGIDNFSFEIIEECLPEQLNEREVYWISQYNSFQEGYNMTPGGTEPIYVNPQEIYDLWDQGYTVGQIEELLSNKMCSCTIRNYLHEYENWSATASRRRSALLASRKENVDDSNQIIKQYDLFGKFIRNWKSAREIERAIKIPHNSICNVLNNKQKQAGGFQWKMGDINDTSNIISIIDIIPLHFEIIQKDLKGNIINRYKNAKEAGQAVKTSPTNITKACKHYNNRKTAKGFVWEYNYDNWIY